MMGIQIDRKIERVGNTSYFVRELTAREMMALAERQKTNDDELANSAEMLALSVCDAVGSPQGVASDYADLPFSMFTALIAAVQKINGMDGQKKA